MQDFSYLVDSIDINMVADIATADLPEADKKTLIAYSIARKLENVSIYFPKKFHRIEYAKILIKYGFSPQNVKQLADISRVTVFRHKRTAHDNNG